MPFGTAAVIGYLPASVMTGDEKRTRLLAAAREIDRATEAPRVVALTVVRFDDLDGPQQSRATAASWAWLCQWHDRLEQLGPSARLLEGADARAWRLIPTGTLGVAHVFDGSEKRVDAGGYREKAKEILRTSEELRGAMDAADWRKVKRTLEKTAGRARASVLWQGTARIEDVSPLGAWRARFALRAARDVLADWIRRWPHEATPAERRALIGSVAVQATGRDETFSQPETEHVAFLLAHAVRELSGRALDHHDLCRRIDSAAESAVVHDTLAEPKRGAKAAADAHLSEILELPVRDEIGKILRPSEGAHEKL